MKRLNIMLTFAVANAFSVPIFATEQAHFYGKANLSFQQSDDGEGHFSEINSNASRIGVLGEQTLKHDVTVFYKVEVEAHMDDTKTDTFTARNQYLGLKNHLGSILIGKNDTILKQSQGLVDQFGDIDGDLGTLWNGVGEVRASDSFTYKSPKIDNLQFGFTYITEGSKDGEDGLSTGVFYGDKRLKKTKVYAAVALDNNVKGYDTTRISIATRAAGFVLGAMFQTHENNALGLEMDGYLVNMAYDIDDYTLKTQFQTAKVDDGDETAGVSVGVDYRLANNLRMYSFYSTFDMDQNEDQDYAGVGLAYKF